MSSKSEKSILFTFLIAPYLIVMEKTSNRSNRLEIIGRMAANIPKTHVRMFKSDFKFMTIFLKDE